MKKKKPKLNITCSLHNRSWSLLLLLLLASCNKALFDAGEIQTHEIKIDKPFSYVNIQNIFDVVLVQDTINKVYITCGENLQSFVAIEVEDDILFLDHSAKQSWSRQYQRIKLEVHLSSFPRIDIHEPVNLKTKGVFKGESFVLIDWGKVSEVDVDLDVNVCAINMSSDNFGYFKVKGKALYSDIWGWGSATVRADSLISQDCHVTQRGMADVYVNVTNKLAVSLEFTGDVYYTGNPTGITIEKQLSSGKLIKLR